MSKITHLYTINKEKIYHNYRKRKADKGIKNEFKIVVRNDGFILSRAGCDRTFPTWKFFIKSLIKTCPPFWDRGY